MTLILIIFCIWGASALIRASKDEKRKRAEAQRSAELERIRRAQDWQRAEQQRIREEWRAEQAAEKERVRQMVALEKEQARQAKEQERIAKEQERQAEVLRKHEERLLRLEQKLELAQREEAHYADEVDAITIDMSGVKAYVNYMKDRGLPCKGKEAELEKLNKKLYNAETKLIKARQTRELCEKQMNA